MKNRVKKARYEHHQMTPIFCPESGVGNTPYQMEENVTQSSSFCKANSTEVENDLNFRRQFPKSQTHL